MSYWQGMLRKLVFVGALLVLSACGGTGPIPPTGATQTYFETIFSGMLMDAEPDEGDIPDSGRTYRGAFKPWNTEEIKGIQMLLGNLKASDVRGAKMLIGISGNRNWDLLPTNNGVVNNSITGNARTGWVEVTLGGAKDLPVRADADGTGLAWTDLVSFSPALKANEDVDIVWRIWLPKRSASTAYARTFSGGRDYNDHKLSPIVSLVALRREFFDTRDWQSFSAADGFGRADGNFVSNPAASAEWVKTPGDTIAAYGRNFVSSIPILGYRFKAARTLPLIEFVGDSITQGYGDGEQTLGIDGVPGRLLRQFGVGGDAVYNIVNFGQSGFTPEEYLARWKGLARADTSGGTALVYSIYSPNGFSGGTDTTPDNMTSARIEAMKANCLAAESAAHDYGRIFIPAFITGTNYGLIGIGRDDTGLVKNLLDWAKVRYGNQLLDLHSAVQPSGADATVGPSMDEKYTIDGTHPSAAGYSALGAKAVEIFPSVYEAARAAQAGK